MQRDVTADGARLGGERTAPTSAAWFMADPRGCQRGRPSRRRDPPAAFESAVGDQTVAMDEQAEVAAKALDHRDHAGVQRRHRGEAVPLLRMAS